MRNSKTIIVTVAVIILNLIIFSLIIFKTQSDSAAAGIKCFSNTDTRREFSSGRVITSKLTTLVILQENIMALSFKGSVTDEQRQYTVDRTMSLSVTRVGSSKIYHAYHHSLSKTPDDNTPEELFSHIQLDNFDYFYVNQIKDDTYIFDGLVLPIMTCSAF